MDKAGIRATPPPPQDAGIQLRSDPWRPLGSLGRHRRQLAGARRCACAVVRGGGPRGAASAGGVGQRRVELIEQGGVGPEAAAGPGGPNGARLEGGAAPSRIVVRAEWRPQAGQGRTGRTAGGAHRAALRVHGRARSAVPPSPPVAGRGVDVGRVPWAPPWIQAVLVGAPSRWSRPPPAASARGRSATGGSLPRRSAQRALTAWRLVRSQRTIERRAAARLSMMRASISTAASVAGVRWPLR